MLNVLSQGQIARARSIIESAYSGTCTITVHEKYTKPNSTTSYRDSVLVQNQPCQLSYKSVAQANQSNVAATVSQVTKLLISPDITIPTGSKITVTQSDTTVEYKGSGIPAVYATHQEVVLELFDGWS